MVECFHFDVNIEVIKLDMDIPGTVMIAGSYKRNEEIAVIMLLYRVGSDCFIMNCYQMNVLSCKPDLTIGTTIGTKIYGIDCSMTTTHWNASQALG